MKEKECYLGFDIGTDSVGYAVTDEKYNLLKFKGEPAWGTTIFDSAETSEGRRSFRTARRRLDRRQQRVQLLQELFAREISKVDGRFYQRLQESYLFRDDAGEKFTLFNDADFTDKDYFDKYPTIHHLIHELMSSKEPHDVRLVYLACAWLLAHRGHFLSNLDIEHLDEVKDFDGVYQGLMNYFSDNECEEPWQLTDPTLLAEVIKSKQGVTAKTKALIGVLYGGKKPGKEATESFRFGRDSIVKLLAGGTCKLKDLFCCEEYEEYGSVSLGMDDEKLGEIMAGIGDDFALIEALKAITDWAVLVDIIEGYSTISEAKVAVYDQHKKDLKCLKDIMRKYLPERYDEVFRKIGKDNYVAYTKHTDEKDTSKLKGITQEAFSKYVLSVVKGITPDQEDREKYDDMVTRLVGMAFMPKQKTTNNRVIPYQLYAYELKTLLDQAENYLPFLAEEDLAGISIKEKVMSIMTFRIPYFVGPLNASSDHAWIVRKEGKIYPWNFENMVDLDACEVEFIKRMTNRCTYLPGEPVLPKDSLLYHRFMVLNEINNIRINQERISVELKQNIYNELFMNLKKVTRKKLIDYLLSNGVIQKGDEELVTGIDVNINSNLAPQIAFRRLLESKVLSEQDVEKIIERASYAEDKSRLGKWLEKHYSHLSEDDRKYICKIKIKDFGRLSAQFLNGLEGANKETGEVYTIIGALWSTQCNLMELLSDKYSFGDEIRECQQEYYGSKTLTLSDRLDEMYVSNAVKRAVFRTMAIVKDVKKAFGVPKKIFVEMTRGGSEDQKGRRTLSRKQQILDLYAKCKDEDVRILKEQLEAMGEYAENRLQGDKLFLYYMQLGKCMYTGQEIELEKLASKSYDIDHIYPQAFVKDDSVINNKVLVKSEANGEKSDKYPIASAIRNTMRGFWGYLKEQNLISEEKYRRLVRSTPFTEEERWNFINRQIVETSQSTKAVATILKERFPDTEIVYCKARLTSDFRHEFDLPKSRLFNDLHHAVDAYLNIVTGNVYSMKFSKARFSVNSNYSIKTKTLFTHPLVCDGRVVWDGDEMLGKVKRIAEKNTAHLTKFAFFKRGGYFDQMPVQAGPGLVPRKAGLDTEKYGGYNKSGVMFYIPVKYQLGKKKEVMILSVEMLYGERFLADHVFAKEYAFRRLEHILGKKVDSVEFPMGFRPWKVNTMLSLDGYRISISGIGSGGKCLVAQPMTPFADSKRWVLYLKRLENFVEKNSKNANYVYSEEYDKISKEENSMLYSIYLEKYRSTVLKNRVNAPLEILEKGRERFGNLQILEQAKVLLNIHQTFARNSTGGCDLTLIGGAGKAAATVSFSSSISNWKKKYNDVRIVDVSVSGLWTKISDVNLLELV
ncbi:MAG: type II CRISPR RNA-guided endonuclease Cas9 [Lachnospiraceae bacterium]|nr:type II CRISPR RNA-guided endonuclease Cas9 [Lachnospiraceae bacterium]